MWIQELENKWQGSPALVVAGGPGVGYCREQDFSNCRVIGTNFAHRIWNCDYVIPIKDYIFEEIRTEIEPEKLVVPTYIPCQEGSQSYLWNLSLEVTSIHERPLSNSLFGKGCACAAIHLAHRMGASPIFVIGVDLITYFHGQYHSQGYWVTDRFQPMGKRITLAESEKILAEQLELFKLVQLQLRLAGNQIYYLTAHHWREYLSEWLAKAWIL